MFDPNLTFEANPHPLAFGESSMTLHASASLHSAVHLTGA